MKKIVIITNIPSPYRVDFFEFLHRKYKQYDFTIIYSSISEDNRRWKLKKSGKVKSIVLKSKTIKIRKKYDNKYIHIPRNLYSNLNRINPDVIIGSEYNPTVIQALLWSKMKKKKFISWSDGTLFSERKINLIQKFMRSYVVKGADCFIASSTKTKEAQIKYGAMQDKIYISCLTVDIEKYLNQKSEYKNNKILFVGNLCERKGVDLLFKALSRVNVNYKLIIVGSGEQENYLIDLSKELNIYNNIQFEGYKENKELLYYYKTCDLFILPTREDCFGLVTLEAMCNSLPVICSCYADGIYDLLDEQSKQYIVDPYNVFEFSNTIQTLLSDHNLMKKLGERNYYLAHNFSFSIVSKGFIEAIESVI